MLGNERLETTLRYYGISPWEIEVIYGYLVGRFSIKQEELEQEALEPENEEFVSFLEMCIPLEFNDAFFQWFEYKRWEKIKAVFKEMKRRRGSKHALKIKVNFAGRTKIIFIIDTDERQWFNNAIEKMDFVLELLPYHLNPERLPPDTSEVIYRFHADTVRWRLHAAISAGVQYTFKGDSWKAVS